MKNDADLGVESLIMNPTSCLPGLEVTSAQDVREALVLSIIGSSEVLQKLN